MDWTEYAYAALWLLSGLLLIFRFGRENKVFYALGAFFLLLGAWWLADIFVPEDLFAGVWVWVLRVLGAGALLLAVYAYYGEKKKADKKKALEEEALSLGEGKISEELSSHLSQVPPDESEPESESEDNYFSRQDPLEDHWEEEGLEDQEDLENQEGQESPEAAEEMETEMETEAETGAETEKDPRQE